MDPVVVLFLGSCGLTLLWIARRLIVLAQYDRATRHLTRAIQQAPEHSVLPMVEPIAPVELRARALRTSPGAGS